MINFTQQLNVFEVIFAINLPGLGLIIRQITIFSLGATGGGGGTKLKVKTILFFKCLQGPIQTFKRKVFIKPKSTIQTAVE
jgi:hypothetical protein